MREDSEVVIIHPFAGSKESGPDPQVRYNSSRYIPIVSHYIPMISQYIPILPPFLLVKIISFPMFSLWFIELYRIPIIVHSSISFVWIKSHYIILYPYRIPIVYHHFLVGGLNPSEKYEFVSWDHYSQHMESHNPVMFQSPPTSTNQFLCKSSFFHMVSYAAMPKKRREKTGQKRAPPLCCSAGAPARRARDPPRRHCDSAAR